MTLRPLPLASLLLLGTVACAPVFDYRRLAKPVVYGEESTADINLANPNLRGASRKIQVPGEGKITVDVKATNGQAKYMIRVLPESGGAAVAEGDPPLEAEGVTPGGYYVFVQPMNAVSTRIKLNVGYSPKDPDQNSSPDAKPDGANPLEAGRRGSGSVNYSDLDRTDHFAFNAREAGTMKFDVKLTDLKGKVTAAVQPPKGEFTPVDLRTGLSLPDSPAGLYLVRIQAEENSSAKYELSVSNEAGDPDKNSGDDANQEGATVMQFRPGIPPNQVASAKDEVSYDKGDATDWFSFNAPDKGKCSVVLKPKDRASKIKAEYIVRDGQDDGEKVKSGFTGDCDKQPRWVKVYAENRGDGTPYTLEVTYIPSVFIPAKVLELDKKAGCAVWLDKGTNDQVRQGAQVSFVGPNGQTLASGFVDQPPQAKMSHVKVSGNDCAFAGMTVQISGGF